MTDLFSSSEQQTVDILVGGILTPEIIERCAAEMLRRHREYNTLEAVRKRIAADRQMLDEICRSHGYKDWKDLSAKLDAQKERQRLAGEHHLRSDWSVRRMVRRGLSRDDGKVTL